MHAKQLHWNGFDAFDSVIKSPKHYGIADLYLEACEADAHLTVVVNDINASNTLSKVDFREFLRSAQGEFCVEGPSMEQARSCWVGVLTSADFGPTDLAMLLDSHVVPGFKEEKLIEHGLDMDS